MLPEDLHFRQGHIQAHVTAQNGNKAAISVTDASYLVAVDFSMSKYEIMRTDSANWKLGIVYYCKDDPRIIVRNLLPFGWTWNFAHRGVYFAILAAITAFLAPPYLAWQMGVRSALVIGIIAALALIALVIVASRLAQDPEA